MATDKIVWADSSDIDDLLSLLDGAAMADVPHQQSNIMGSTTAGPPSLGHGNHTFRGRVLVIAGSDPSGGAGLEADQKAIAAHGGYAMTATTALTVQNTVGVARVELIDWTFTRDQIEAVFEDIGVDAVKTGMMSSLESVAGIVEVLRSRKMAQNLPFLVVDPVMVASTGACLCPKPVMEAIVHVLLPIADIITPNIEEAKVLCELSGKGERIPEITRWQDLATLARLLLGSSEGPRWVLVKGGHLPFAKDGTVATKEEDRHLVVNALVSHEIEKPIFITTQFVDSKDTHGTGCSLASAIASNLSTGQFDIPGAVRSACQYVDGAIRHAPGLGSGSGPIGHFHRQRSLPFSSSKFLPYVMAHRLCQPALDRLIHHRFPRSIARGTVSEESFTRYLVQDYLFLVQYARIHALAAYKATNMDDIRKSAAVIVGLGEEADTQLAYLESRGLTKKDVEAHKEIEVSTAYTRWIMDIGHVEGRFALLVALAPCIIGYGLVAKRIEKEMPDEAARTDGPCSYWLQYYLSDAYQQIVRDFRRVIEDLAPEQSPSQVEHLVRVFARSCEFEAEFFSAFDSDV